MNNLEVRNSALNTSFYLFFLLGRVSGQNKHVSHILATLISEFIYSILANTRDNAVDTAAPHSDGMVNGK